MRKLQSLFLVLMCLLVQHLYAEPITKPEAGKKYMIQHSSKMFLTIDGGQLKIMLPGTGDVQQFEFVPVEGSDELYNIKLPSGEYLGSDKSYSAVLLTDPADPFAQFSFPVSYDTNFINLKNEGRGACFGSDNNNEGGGVYTDKTGLDGKHLWNIVEVTGGVILTALQDAITNAEGVLAAASVGTEIGDYPQQAVDALQAAIDNAKDALSATEQEIVNEAVITLNNAVSVFASMQIVVSIDPGKQYYFIHYASDLVLGINDNNASVIQNPAGSDNQKFKLVSVAGAANVYNIQLADGTRYITRSGGWDTTVGTDPEADVAKFEFQLADLTKGLIRLKKYNEGGYFGTDTNTDGSLVYTNKGNIDRSWWTLKEVVEGELITTAFDKAILLAEKLVAEAVEGTEPGNYPKEAIDALNAAIQTAKDSRENLKTQEDVNTATVLINAAITTFREAQIDPFFVPAENTAYRIAVRKYSNKYVTNTNGDAKTTAEYTTGDINQHWTFVKVENAEHTFILKNGEKALTYDGTMADFDLASSPKWIIAYAGTFNNIDHYGIIEFDDPTKCVTFSAGNTWAIQDFDATNNAHQARFTRVDMPNDPNLTVLENAVATARYTLKNIDRGNEIGQWNDKKCDAFEAIIMKAETMKGATQEGIDAMVVELQQAQTDFLAHPNAVIKDELEALLVTAREKAEAAVVGIEPGQFFQTVIETFEAQIAEYEKKGNEVSEQEECDALTAEFKTIVETFAGHTAQQTVKVVLDDAIQSAEALYEALKENVGTDKGQRPQEIIDAFKEAIDKAKAITDPVIEDLNALQEARRSFLNGTISVDRKALRTAIATAEGESYKNLVAGTFDGQYPQEKIDAFNAALNAAKEAETDLSKTQEDINICAKNLNDAIKALNASKVVIVFTGLDEALAIAEPSLASATIIGDGEGQCPQSVVDAFQAVIDEVKAVDRKAIAQVDVDALTVKLNEAIATFRTELVASTGLQALIDKAKAQLDASVEGFKPGNYPVTARSQFRKSIEEAQAVVDAKEVSQTDLLASVEALKAAIAKFESALIPANDLTDLNAAIAEADAFIVKHGEGFTALNIALAKAKAVVESPDDYAKSDVKKILEDLKKALKAAQSSVGIQDTRLTSLAIYDVDGTLFIEGLEGKCRIIVYSANGMQMSSVETSESVYSVPAMQAGTYIVTVQGEQMTGSRVVIIR